MFFSHTAHNSSHSSAHSEHGNHSEHAAHAIAEQLPLATETVFNAPASHLAAMLESRGPAYTLIGDSAQFLGGMDLGIEWLLDNQVDGVLVVGSVDGRLKRDRDRILLPKVRYLHSCLNVVNYLLG